MKLNCYSSSSVTRYFDHISHRVLTYLITNVVLQKHNKQPIVHLGNSFKDFLSKINIFNHKSAKDAIELRKQIDLALKLVISVSYSNSNKTTRQNFKDVALIADNENLDFIMNTTLKWQKSITINQQAVEFIRSCAVPISKYVTYNSTSIKHIFLLNYFLYQNYNLVTNEKASAEYDLTNLSTAIGCDIDSLLSSFRYLIKANNIFQTLKLNKFIALKNKKILLTADNSLTLTKNERVVKPRNLETIFKSRVKDKLLKTKQYNNLQLTAIEKYIENRVNKGVLIRNLNAYALGVLKNTDWEFPEYNSTLMAYDSKSFRFFENNTSGLNEVKRLFSKFLKLSNQMLLPVELRKVQSQLNDPGTIKLRLPGFHYLLYVFATRLNIIKSDVDHSLTPDLFASNLDRFINWVDYVKKEGK